MTRIPTLFISLVLLSAVEATESELVSIGISEFPPYYGEELENYGFVKEIVEQAYMRVGYKIKIDFFPWARVLEYGKKGKVDAVLAIWYSKQREKWFAFSHPLHPNMLGFYKRKSDKIDFTSYQDLLSYEIGIVRGYANPPGFDEAQLKTQLATNDMQNLQKLYAKRVDLIVIDKGVAKYIIETNYPDFAAELVWVNPPLQTNFLYLGFSKKAENYQKKLRDFNLGLVRLIEEGELRKILDKYGY